MAEPLPRGVRQTDGVGAIRWYTLDLDADGLSVDVSSEQLADRFRSFVRVALQERCCSLGICPALTAELFQE